jgi:ADP-heptose:LPS heptosyltransferase
MQFDLVITVDTSVAHLAGALGRPVWLLLSFAQDWRWLRERTDSPWYPSVRIFPQTSLDDWKNVFIGVTEPLKHLACKKQDTK